MIKVRKMRCREREPDLFPNILGHVFVQRTHQEGLARIVIWIQRGQSTSDGLELGVRGADRHAVLQACHAEQGMTVALRLFIFPHEGRSKQAILRAHPRTHEFEVGRHHAHERGIRPVQPQRAAHGEGNADGIFPRGRSCSSGYGKSPPRELGGAGSSPAVEPVDKGRFGDPSLPWSTHPHPLALSGHLRPHAEATSRSGTNSIFPIGKIQLTFTLWLFSWIASSLRFSQ